MRSICSCCGTIILEHVTRITLDSSDGITLERTACEDCADGIIRRLQRWGGRAGRDHFDNVGEMVEPDRGPRPAA